MKFGLCYIADHHPAHQGSHRQWYEGMIEEVVAADRLGYDGVFLAEHHFPDFAFGSPAVFLAALARETSRIRLGTSVSLLPLNDPLRLAEDYAMVDVLSNGRLDYGVGRGAYKYDYDACGVDMAESRERFTENLEIIDRAWSTIGFSYEGRWTNVADHSITPRPVQQPRPPIWVAATLSKETFAWAGEHGYNLETVPFFYNDPADLQQRLTIYRDALTAHGHDPAEKQIAAAYHMHCAPSHDAVVREVVPALERFQFFGKGVDASRHAYRDPQAYREWQEFYAGQGFSAAREQINLDDLNASRSVFGTPDECIDKIGRIRELFGIEYLIFEVNFGGLAHERVMESLELFADEVMPAFADQAVGASAP